ncbi:MAG: hypothetical protein GX474_02465 [Bacteroidales bacterium]|nr:hypothetical protein [Bacteroidales bacterium]HPJ82249.1 hypothetical protein [Bacteroidales bacterium]
MFNKRLTGTIVALAFIVPVLHGCSGNPFRFVDNAYVGTWHIDTSRVSISISVDAGNAADLQVFLPFVAENYQNLRSLLKEPHTIKVAGSTRDDPYSGSYSLVFSYGNIYTSSYKLLRNILFLAFYYNSGTRFTIPCQADGNTLQIVYSTPYMRALIRDYIEDHFTDQADHYLSVFSSISVTIEGFSIYNTRTRDSAGQYVQP